MRGKPIEVRMAMLSSGGELPSGVAPMGLSLVERPGSIMEGRVRGSAKSEKNERIIMREMLCLFFTQSMNRFLSEVEVSRI